MARKAQTVGICKLCGDTTQLKDSHIVPRFLTKGSKLSPTKYHLLNLGDDNKSKYHIQDAFREPLLCWNCEQRFSLWESYARDKIYGKGNPFTYGETVGYVWSGLDYAKMKLFIISILWRMSVSTLDFYSKVDLGDRHNSLMREMLWHGNPMEVWRYGCTLAFLHYGGKRLEGGMFSQPHSTRVGNNLRIYRFILSKFLVYINVTSHPPSIAEQIGYLQLNGDWNIPIAEAMSIPFIKEDIMKFPTLTHTISKLKLRSV